MIPREQAEDEVALAVERLALLHLAFAQTLFEEFGEKRGRELVIKAIRNYGEKIGTKAREATQDLELPLYPDNYDAGGPNWPSLGTCDRIETLVVDGLVRAAVAQFERPIGRQYQQRHL